MKVLKTFKFESTCSRCGTARCLHALNCHKNYFCTLSLGFLSSCVCVLSFMPYVSNFIAHLKSYFIIAYVKVRWLHMSRILDLLTDTNTLSIQGSRIVSQRVIKKSQCPIENFPQSESITHHVTKHITIQFWSNILCRSMLEVSGNWMNITWWIFWESSCIMLGGELRWCLKCERSWVFLMSLQFWGTKSIVLLYACLFSFSPSNIVPITFGKKYVFLFSQILS